MTLESADHGQRKVTMTRKGVAVFALIVAAFSHVDAQTCKLDFEDLVLGTSYTAGSTFTTKCVRVRVSDLFSSPPAGCVPPTTSSNVMVEDMGLACSTGNELHINNVNLEFDFGGPVKNLQILYGEYGGNINLEVNGDCQNVENFNNLPAVMGTPPVTVSIVDFGTPGNSCGMLKLSGETSSFTIGGQELWIDCFDFDDADFVRGDCNADGTINITDGVVLLNALFSGGVCHPCQDASDANDDGTVNVTDAVYKFNWLFLNGPPPPPPTPFDGSGVPSAAYDPSLSCGPDPTPDRLFCPSFPPCP